MEYSGKVYAKIGGRYVPLEATAEEIDEWKKAYESQPKQLSDEEIITAMIDRAEELELDLYKEEVEELYKVVRDRTGGGVDLEDLIVWAYVKGLCVDDYVPHDYQPTFQEYLAQRTQQEK